MAERRIDIKVLPKPNLKNIQHLLIEGDLVGYMEKKWDIMKEWKRNRYRICLECAKEKLRTDFTGESKYCRRCVRKRAIQSVTRKAEYRKMYNSTPKGRIIWHCKQIVYHLKKLGIIIPSACELCGEEKTQAHHDSYLEPTKVRFLCGTCHKEWHKLNNPIYE